MSSLEMASAATLVNGANQTGTIVVSTTNSYTFTANKGDNINLRMGTTNFDGLLQLFGPGGNLLETGTGGGSTDVFVDDYTATNSGTFTVNVASWYGGGAGTYELHLAQIPESFIVPAGGSGGPLANGADASGTITLGDIQMWSFPANKGDSVNLRLGTTNFDGLLQLFGPDGSLLATGAGGGSTDDFIDNYTTTNSGTFTVHVSSWYGGQMGNYVLHLAQVPEAFIVPVGEEGGPLTNGADATGTLTVGDLQMWSFPANRGDNINLRLGTTNFDGLLQLFGPDGSLLVTGAGGGSTDDFIDSYRATNSGTFTVHISSWYGSGMGNYTLHLGQVPEAFIVPAGEEGGPLTNGADATGTITVGDLQMWSFPANTGDNISLRLGTTNFDGLLQLFGPDGSLLVTGAGGGSTDEFIDSYRATNSGTFTVHISSWYGSDSGTYELRLAQVPEAFVVPAGAAGGPLTNGADTTGTIDLGDIDMWSFPANMGDSINLRLGTTNFDGRLELFGPDGALLATGAGGGGTDEFIDNYRATNSGTFTVHVSSWYTPGAGTYQLRLAQAPEAFIVPAGGAGGPLTNGVNATGTITLGSIDIWSFPANAGDNINLRVGTTNFDGLLQLFGPDGALLATGAGGGGTDDVINNYTATNSGTFTVHVSSWYTPGMGTYELHLAQIPEAFVVPVGQAGGLMTGSASYLGTLNLGDLDRWAFTACTGDLISLQLNSTNFDGLLQLFGPNGQLLATGAGGGSTHVVINYKATRCGAFNVLASSWFTGGIGSYGLIVNGLVDNMRLCAPVVTRTNLTLNGVGGTNGVGFDLYSTTNLAMPFALWTRALTSHFDQFGVLSFTNIYNPPPAPQMFFRFVVP